MPSTSSRSLEIIQTATPAAGQLVHQRVNLAFGPDVHAAGRLVEDQHLRVAGQPLAETTFCWLPPDSRPTGWRGRGVFTRSRSIQVAVQVRSVAGGRPSQRARAGRGSAGSG